MKSLLLTENEFELAIPDKAVVEEPIHLVMPEEARETHPRIRIRAGVSTRLKIILEENSVSGGGYPSDGILEVFLAKGACVNFFQIQKLGKDAQSSWVNRFHLKQHASLDTMIFTSGGAVAKNETTVTFEEEHAFCSLKGLSILTGKSQVFHKIFANHQAPYGISRQHYKQIVAGSSKAEFDSLVDVSHEGVHSDTRQLCRNLLLSDLALGFARPKLKISTDDVTCTHGATTGQLDKNELFYMRSRGLSKELAKYLLTDGFAREVVEEIQDIEMKKRFSGLVDQELKAL